MVKAFFFWRNRLASAGTVTVDFTAETARFTAELRKVNTSVKDFESSLSHAAETAKVAFEALIFAEFTAQITESIAKSLELGEAIALASQKAGISAEAFSELTFAAKLSNVGIDDLSNALKHMQVEVANGGKVIQSLGVDFDVLRSLSPDKQFELVAEAISAIEDPAIKTAAAVAVFGKQGANLLPIFEGGAKGIRALREEAIKTGSALSNEQVKALDEAKQSVDALGLAYDGLRSRIVALAAPAITAVIKGIGSTFSEPTEFEKASARLNDFIKERNFLIGEIRRKESLNEKFDFLVSDKSIEAAKLQLSQVEARINLVNDRLLKLGVTAQAKEIKDAAPVAGLDPTKRTFGDLQAAQTDAINKELEQMAADSANALDKITEASNQKFFEGQAEKTRIVERELQRQGEAEQRLADFREQEIANDKARQRELSNIKVDIVQGGLDLIAAVTTKDAKLQKKIAIAAATINTIQGVTNQLKSGDPYSAIPRAIAVGIFGAAQIAKIISTPELGGGGSGSIGGGGVSIGTQPTSSFNQTATGPQTPQAQPAVVQLVVNGNFYSNDQAKKELIESLEDFFDRDGMLIKNKNSAQASFFMG